MLGSIMGISDGTKAIGFSLIVDADSTRWCSFRLLEGTGATTIVVPNHTVKGVAFARI